MEDTAGLGATRLLCLMNFDVTSLADVLNGLLTKGRWKGTMPRVHCYCFMRSKETNRDIIKVGVATVVALHLHFCLNFTS